MFVGVPAKFPEEILQYGLAVFLVKGNALFSVKAERGISA